MTTLRARAKYSGVLVFSIFLIVQSCLVGDQSYTKVAPGYWRGTLKLDNTPVNTAYREPTLETIGNLKLESVTEGILPFNFEVIYPTSDSFYIELINGQERIRINTIRFGHDKRTAYDTIRIDFPVYDSYIIANIVGSVMEGHWVVNYRKDKSGVYKIPFKAEYGKQDRFNDLKIKPTTDLTGSWKMTFIDEAPFVGIAELKQINNNVHGTIRTETGDYRYLDGLIQKDKLYLSVFDGSHAFLFEAKLLDEDEMFGTFASGKHYKVGWTARRNDTFELANPYQMTKVIDPSVNFSFSFPDPSGHQVSLSDSAFANKVKIIELMGTWCPNCRDASHFLTSLINQQQTKDLAVIAISFERYRDEDKAMASIKRYREKLNIPYPILYGGYADKNETQSKFGLLDKIYSYPTLIILNRDNKVIKIYTGFNGPATSKYVSFKQEFYSIIESLSQTN